MKWLAFVKIALYSKRHSFALLTPYLSLSVRLLLGLATVGLGADALAHVTSQTLSNPFESYRDIFPGQPMSALEGRGFSCQFAQDHNYYATPLEGQCLLTPATGRFSSIEVSITAQRVQLIRFSLRENTFKLGDLLVMFNVPDFRVYPQTTFAFWHDYFVALPTNQHSSINPIDEQVWSVAFTWAEKTQ